MKKLLFVAASLALGFGAVAQTEPTIVSKEAQKRNVVIEEYTGIGCGYCPLGHQNVATFRKNNPDRVVTINIHQGGYTRGYRPNYTTEWGDKLYSQADITGYPAGTMNRLRVTDKSADNYGSIYNFGPTGDRWQSSASNLLNEDCPVNVAATASIDVKTRKLTVHVEAYYTADARPDSVNLLNIALLQNNIEGDQHNYGKAVQGSLYNPEQCLYAYDDYSSAYNTRYLHMHMLRDFVTENWGDTIAAVNEDGIIPAGTFFAKDYTYDIPEEYTDYNEGSTSKVPCVFGDIELAVYITEGLKASEHWTYNYDYNGSTYQQSGDVIAPNIYTGINVEPEYVNMDELYAYMADLQFIPQAGCVDLAGLSLNVRNIGFKGLTSIKFEYTNEKVGDTKTFTWTGEEFITFESTNIAFEEPITVETGKQSTVKVKIVELNGTALDEAIEISGNYTKPAPKEGKGIASVIIRTDKKGSEVSWFVYDSEGQTIAQSPAYADGTVIRDTVKLEMLTEEGCYTFEIKDAGKDGIDGGQYKIVSPNKNVIVSNTSLKGIGAGEMADFKIIGFEEVGLNEANGNIFQSMIYPNPAKDVATLNINMGQSDNAVINVVDLMGREVMNLGQQNLKSGENILQINTSELANGIYYVRIITNNGMVTNKLNVVK
ncbi:MAG: Omp28-related outer membrane protein [Bacteroidales bacterium]|nr:Omp28-related outer membrane protein [Bacteroidales bacterium]